MARRRITEKPAAAPTDVQMPGSMGRWGAVFVARGSRILQINVAPAVKATTHEELPWVTPATLQPTDAKKLN
jgi:hypothetical protein